MLNLDTWKMKEGRNKRGMFVFLANLEILKELLV